MYDDIEIFECCIILKEKLGSKKTKRALTEQQKSTMVIYA
jgi:hypothetical protein